MKRAAPVVLLVVFLVVGISGGSFQPSVSLAQSSADVVVNEVMFNAAGDDAGKEWIELYNKGDEAVGLSGWTVSDGSGDTVATLPDWSLPAGDYLVIVFGAGTNDSDFSDGSGWFYTGGTEEVFDNSGDGAGLYDAAPGASSIVDFIRWCFPSSASSERCSPEVPGPKTYWLTAGIWSADDWFGKPGEFMELVAAGESIGRDKDSTDTDTSEDWRGCGGIDAVAATPGARNLHTLRIWPGAAIIPTPPQKQWTIMAYMGADNDLEKDIFRNLNQMEEKGSDDNINIVFQFDGNSSVHEVTLTGGVLTPVAGTHGKTFRGLLQPDPAGDSSLVRVYPAADGVYKLGEKNMAEPTTLSGFVAWAVTNFPAQRYALIITDHGDGWKGVVQDWTDGDDYLYMGELKAALAGSPVLDILGFDACLMGMIEVGWQVRDRASILVASEEGIDGHGWPWLDILTGLKATPGMDGEQLATMMVSDYHNYYSTEVDDPIHTLSAVRLGDDFAALVSDVSDFADDMLGEHAQDEWGLEDYDFRFANHYDPDDNVQMDVRTALRATEYMYNDANFKDLYRLMELIDAQASIPPEYKARAAPIVGRLGKGGAVVIAEEHGPDHPNAHGLTIYFPTTQTEYYQRACYFCDSEECEDGVEDPFDDPWPSCLTDASSSLAVYAEDKTVEWGMVPYLPPGPPHPLPGTPNFDFPTTNWDEFLHRYYKPVADAGEDQCLLAVPGAGVVVMLNGSGSSDADGNITRYIWDLDAARNTDNGDWDKDGVDEANDDKDLPGAEGPIAFAYLGAGNHTIKLTVWDNHQEYEHDTPADSSLTTFVSHDNHWKTDQDHCVVAVASSFTYPTPEGERVPRRIDPVTVIYERVVTPGNTTIAVTEESTCGPVPSGIQRISPFVEVSTTAGYSGPIAVGIEYDESRAPKENRVRVYHCRASQWVDVTTSVDTWNNVAYGEDLTLSPWFVGYPVETTPAFPSVYVGVAAAFAAAVLAYALRRRVLRQG